MKKNLTILLVLISISCFSQNFSKKKHYYFQDSELTKAEFESLDKRKIFTRINENDSTIIENVYLHKNIIKFDSIQLLQIKMYLTKMIGPNFNQEKKTMIHLYSNNDGNIYKDANHKKYWNWIKKNSNQYQAYLIGTKDSQIKPEKSKHIFIDQNNLLEKLFFQDIDFKINHLLIKSNGEIYVYFGLNDILQVLDWSVD